MAKRTATDAALPERGRSEDNCNILLPSSTPSLMFCNICLKPERSSSSPHFKKSSPPLVQDFRISSSSNNVSPNYFGHNVAHLSCIVDNAAQYALQYIICSSFHKQSNLNHLSNSFRNFLDTTTTSSSSSCNQQHDGDDDSLGKQQNIMFSCLSYTFLLSNLDRMIESERFLLKIIETSQRLFGSSHSCTQAAQLALMQKKLRFVIVQYLGNSCVFRALRYMSDEDSYCMVQGPIMNDSCSDGTSSRRSNSISKEQQPPHPPQQPQIIVFPSKSIIPTLGTPVICHGCIQHQAHLNGKIGDVRSINRVTGECEIHFESITMEPQLIKAEHLRVLFDLPACQNLDYNFAPDEMIGNRRYKLVERMGKGAFGQVVKAVDTQTSCEVAIKIIKRSTPQQNFFLQAQTEIELLTRIQMKDALGRESIVRLLNTFMHNDHQCIVFEPLTMTLYQLLVDTKFRGLKLDVVRMFAEQLLQALAYLARPDVDIIHCDLKPENVMLENPMRNGIKLIDFGSACKSSEKSYTYIQSRFYRSPEVILGLPYSASIDMWSLGCMLVELYTGKPLFSGSDEVQMVNKFVAILGMPPDEMINQVKRKLQRKFFRKKEGKWTIKQSARGKTNAITPSHNPNASLKEAISRACTKEKSCEDHDRFVDMILLMLSYQTQGRISPAQGLQHPFIILRQQMYEPKR